MKRILKLKANLKKLNKSIQSKGIKFIGKTLLQYRTRITCTDIKA